MKKTLFTLATLLLFLVSWTVERQIQGIVRYEWEDTAAPGSQAKAISGSLTRRGHYPQGLSLVVRFEDGARFAWGGDAAMAPVGLVERGGVVYLVLQEWGRAHGQVVAGQASKSLVCHVREPASGQDQTRTQVTSLFVPTDVPNVIWPWVRYAQVDAQTINRYQRADASVLMAQVAAAAPSGVGACPDLRRADHV